MAHDMQPRFSPDGTTIVFVSDRSGDNNVWMLSLADGATTPLTEGTRSSYLSPEWTPDGQYVVVSRSAPLQGPAKLWLYHAKGGTGLPLVKEPRGLRMLGPAFGPDGRYVWYAQRFNSWQYNAILPQYQIGVYDRESGTRTTMSSRYGSAFRPALSPDGKWLAYGSRHDAETGLRIRELATGEERWLAHPIQRDEQESIANMDVLPGYSFTPDSRAIVISYGGEIWWVPIDGSQAAKIPFTVNAEVPVGPEIAFDYPVSDDPTFIVKQIRDAVPSPDGSKIAFTALDRLYLMDLPDGTPRRLTNREVGEYHPTWSPDGGSVAFVTWDDSDGHIMRVSASGGTPRQLTQVSAYYQQTAWSPDGRRIVAMRAAARNLHESIGPRVFNGLGSEFVWVPADGGAVTVIGPTEGNSRPHFTADPDRIFTYGRMPAANGQPATVALVSRRWDNTDLEAHLRVTWRLPLLAGGWEVSETSDLLMPRDFSSEAREGGIPEISANLVLMAPQGDRALAQVHRDVYVIPVPMTGGEVPTVMVTKPDSASMPIRKLTDIGGEFAAWGADGRTVHWSIGNALVTYRLDRAEAVDDSLRQAGADSAAADRRHGLAGHSTRHGGAAWCQRNHYAGRRGHRERGRRRPGQPNHRRWPARIGSRRRARHRREWHDHHSRFRGYPRPHVEPVGTALDTTLDLLRQPRLRCDHDTRSADSHHRRADVRRPGGGGSDAGTAGVLHRARCLLDRRHPRLGSREDRAAPL
jgi:Tol biopolymer transport system component